MRGRKIVSDPLNIEQQLKPAKSQLEILRRIRDIVLKDNNLASPVVESQNALSPPSDPLAN